MGETEKERQGKLLNEAGAGFVEPTQEAPEDESPDVGFKHVVKNEVQLTREEARATYAVNELNKVGEKFESALHAHGKAMSEIAKKVKQERLTEKVAGEKRAEQGEILGERLLELADELIEKENATESALEVVEDPTTPEEKNRERMTEALDRNVKYILKKHGGEGDGWYDALTPEDFNQMTTHLLREELGNLNSTLRQNELRNAMLVVTGGQEIDRSGPGIKGKNLDAYSYRVSLYKKALATGDKDAIEVFEAPHNENAFYISSADKGKKAWIEFMKVKADAELKRINPEVERKKGVAADLRVRASQGKLELGEKIASLANSGQLILDDSDVQKLSRLLQPQTFPLGRGGQSARFSTGLNSFLVKRHKIQAEKKKGE